MNSAENLQAALLAAAGDYLIPVDRTAALYKYAQTKSLGQYLSAEFPLHYKDVTYRAQIFERGIVFMQSDQPNSIQVLKHTLYPDSTRPTKVVETSPKPEPKGLLQRWLRVLGLY